MCVDQERGCTFCDNAISFTELDLTCSASSRSRSKAVKLIAPDTYFEIGSAQLSSNRSMSMLSYRQPDKSWCGATPKTLDPFLPYNILQTQQKSTILGTTL